MKNFDVMLRDKKMKVDEYNQRYSNVASIRTFVYLQLGIHFGTVPYVTYALEQLADVQNASLYPKLAFQQLLGELIKTMEALPTTEVYPASATLVTTVDQYNTQKFFINKNVLLGELHLWNGAYDNASYRKAAIAYRRVMQTATNTGASGDTYYSQYRISYGDVTSSNVIVVQYIRFRESDINALIENNTEGWRSLFSRGQVNYDDRFNWEWIWTLPFNRNFQPKNPFIELFSDRGGSYLVKPSQNAIDNWNSQVQVNNFPFDARGRFTYKIINGQPVIMKYLYYTIDGNTFAPVLNTNGRTGEWWLYRAATLHLHYAEAANRDGRYKLANALLNGGIRGAYDNTTSADKTNSMQTFDIPPYDFDARQGDAPAPVFRSEWFRNVGIRGRAFVKPVQVTGDSLTSTEDLLINEGALETAYEGHRWPDLLRVALRRNDPSFLADKVYDKLRKDGDGNAAAVRAKLMNKSNWYLPFKWE